MQKKLRALIMGATALTASFTLAGNATAAGPSCWAYYDYSSRYCSTLSGFDKALCDSQNAQTQAVCYNILANQTLTDMEKNRLVARLGWPGR